MKLTIHSLLNLNMLSHFLLTKFSKSILFSCLQKVGHVTNYCKRPMKETWKRDRSFLTVSF